MGIFLPLSNFPLLKGLKLATKLPSNSKFIFVLLVVTELFLSLPSFHDLLNLTKSFYLRHKALFSAFIISSLSPGSNKSRSIGVLECDMTLTQRHNFLKSAAPASLCRVTVTQPALEMRRKWKTENHSSSEFSQQQQESVL